MESSFGENISRMPGEIPTRYGVSQQPVSAQSKPARLAIALADDHDFTRECIATCLQALCTDMDVVKFADLADCTAAPPGTFDVVFYHLRKGRARNEAGGDALAEWVQKLTPTPLVVVSDADDLDTSLDALTAGARGFIPTVNMSPALTIEVIRLVRAGGTFAPVSIPLMRRANSQPKAQIGLPADRFTPRQLAVLEHLQRGSANKIIAHELAMSEGTVKVHVRNIMKKLRATNRTQAVFRAYNLAAGVDAAPAEAATARSKWPKAAE